MADIQVGERIWFKKDVFWSNRKVDGTGVVLAVDTGPVGNTYTVK